MKKIIIMIMNMAFTLSAYAQISGGEIKRLAPKRIPNRNALVQKNHSTEELYEMGKNYTDKGNSEEAEKWYRKAAEKGHREAQYTLGCMYKHSNGTEAVNWLLNLSKSNDTLYSAKANYQLGKIYFHGLGGISQNYYNAFMYFKMASDMGCKEAMYYLGNCYEYGRGTAKNIPFAKDYYKKSGYNHLPSWD